MQVTNTDSLKIDNTREETKFSDLLIKLLKKSNMEETEIEQGKQIIAKFASESTISKNRNWLENVSVRKHDSLLFDVPKFSHSEKSNLPKVLTTAGKISEESKFDGRSESGKNMQ